MLITTSLVCGVDVVVVVVFSAVLSCISVRFGLFLLLYLGTCVEKKTFFFIDIFFVKIEIGLKLEFHVGRATKYCVYSSFCFSFGYIFGLAILCAVSLYRVRSARTQRVEERRCEYGWL